MTILHKNEFIFVHIPKCGGCSVARPQYYKRFGHDLRNENFKYYKDSTLRKNSQFSFTFVRNPWERLISSYKYLSNGGNNINDLKDYNNLFSKHGSLKNTILNWDVSYFNQIHFKPQCDWICDDTKNIIVDFVGRFENLQKDYDTVCDKIGIPRQELPHENKTTHKHYTEYYDDETRQIVAEKYAKDIEYFDYKFGD